MSGLPSLGRGESCVAVSEDSSSTAISLPFALPFLATSAEEHGSVRRFAGELTGLWVNGFRPLPCLVAPAFRGETLIPELPPTSNDAFDVNPNSSTSTTSISCPGWSSSSSNAAFSTPTMLPLPYIHFPAAKPPSADFFIHSIRLRHGCWSCGMYARMWNVCPPLNGVSLSRGGVRCVRHWTNPQHFSWKFVNVPALNRKVVVSIGPWKLLRGAMFGKRPSTSLRDRVETLEGCSVAV